MTDTAPNSGYRHDVQARVDELPSQMSPDEKAGQLTQHFCVRLPAGAEVDPTLPNGCRGATPSGGAGLAVRPGSLLFVTHPRRSTGCSGSPSRHPAAIRIRRDPRSSDDLASPDIDGSVLGRGDHRAGSGRGGARGTRSRSSSRKVTRASCLIGSLSFSLIRDGSAGFVIRCHACNRRRAV
jgi:hypothetical protein